MTQEQTPKLRGRVHRVIRSNKNGGAYYGFIFDEDGGKFFFHSDDVVKGHKNRMKEGAAVVFGEGPLLKHDAHKRAANVALLEEAAA